MWLPRSLQERMGPAMAPLSPWGEGLGVRGRQDAFGLTYECPDLFSWKAHQPDHPGRVERGELAPGRLRKARRLRGAAQDTVREDDAGPGDRRSQEVGVARPRRGGISDRPEMELHAPPAPRAQVP